MSSLCRECGSHEGIERVEWEEAGEIANLYADDDGAPYVACAVCNPGGVMPERMKPVRFCAETGESCSNLLEHNLKSTKLVL